MKPFLFIPLLCLSGWAIAGQDTTRAAAPPTTQLQHLTYEPHTVMATASFGFINAYRTDYTLPASFQKVRTTGFAPIAARLEYTLNKHWSIAALLAYNQLQYHINQLHPANPEPISRPRINTFRLISAGVAGYYHFSHLWPRSRFAPFIGAGLSLNNIQYSHLPQGDSLVAIKEHTATPTVKIGTRWYLSDHVSLYADAGYERQALFSLGASCRFFKKTATIHTESQP